MMCSKSGFADMQKLLEAIPNKITDTMGIVADINLLDENDLQYIEILWKSEQFIKANVWRKVIMGELKTKREQILYF